MFPDREIMCDQAMDWFDISRTGNVSVPPFQIDTQRIDEDADKGKGKEPPPVNAEPVTRQFRRTFGTAIQMKSALRWRQYAGGGGHGGLRRPDVI